MLTGDCVTEYKARGGWQNFQQSNAQDSAFTAVPLMGGLRSHKLALQVHQQNKETQDLVQGSQQCSLLQTFISGALFTLKKKKKESKGKGQQATCMGFTVLFRVVKQGLPKMVTFGQRPEGSERVKREFQIDLYLQIWLKI